LHYCGRETSRTSARTSPSSYGAAVPNIATDQSTFSAEAWSQWALFVGPVVLNGRFPSKKYYNHFCDLIELINLCLKFEFSKDDISKIRDGFIRWVQKYKRYIPLSPSPIWTPIDQGIGTIISTSQTNSHA
jgi:hypothetical protein